MKRTYTKPSTELEIVELDEIILKSGEFGGGDPNEVGSDWIWGDNF